MNPNYQLTNSANEVLRRATRLHQDALSSGNEQLLSILGSLLSDPNGCAASVLQSLGGHVDSMRRVAIERATSPEPGSYQRFDRDVFLKRAQNESQCLGHNVIGDEHLLLALCCEYALEVVQLFSDFRLSSSRIRREVFLTLGRIDLVTQGKLMTWDFIDSENGFHESDKSMNHS